MPLTIIPILIGACGTVNKGLQKGLENLEVGGQMETIETNTFWKPPEYWEESWRRVETCCHSNSSERPLAYADVKNSNE